MGKPRTWAGIRSTVEILESPNRISLWSAYSAAFILVTAGMISAGVYTGSFWMPELPIPWGM